jgi:hypothetical protein
LPLLHAQQTVVSHLLVLLLLLLLLLLGCGSVKSRQQQAAACCLRIWTHCCLPHLCYLGCRAPNAALARVLKRLLLLLLGWLARV